MPRKFDEANRCFMSSDRQVIELGRWVTRLSLLLGVFGTVNLYAASESIAARDVGAWTQVGHVRYEHCDFKDAARAFTKALRFRPEDAGLHHWLGKSYARMAEVASPLHASRDARKARVSLERAVELAPRNQEYLKE